MGQVVGVPVTPPVGVDMGVLVIPPVVVVVGLGTRGVLVGVLLGVEVGGVPVTVGVGVPPTGPEGSGQT